MSKLRPSIRCSTEIGPWTDPVLVVHLPLGNIVRHHGPEFHLYANNTQLYFAFRLGTAEQHSSLACIEACVSRIDSWLVQNKLKLNTGKTELLILNASHHPRPPIETIQVVPNSCNSLLSGLPRFLIDRLQTVQNCAARFVTRSGKHDHITPILK